MATIPMVPSGILAAFPGRDYVKGVSVISTKLNFADAVTAKGSAIAASDLFRIVKVPQHGILIGGSVFVEEVPASGSLDATLDIGYSGAADRIVDGVSVFASGIAAVGTNGNLIFTGGLRLDGLTDQSIDVKIATLSGTLASGVVRVDLIVADMGQHPGRFAKRGAGMDPKS